MVGLIFIAPQHAMHAERDIVMANPSVRPSVYLPVRLSMSNAGVMSK